MMASFYPEQGVCLVASVCGESILAAREGQNGMDNGMDESDSSIEK